MNELKTYKIICDKCGGDGKHLLQKINVFAGQDEEENIRTGCIKCRITGFLYVDWVDFLKTEKNRRIGGIV